MWVWICTGRGLTGVDARSEGLAEFVAINEQANHEIVPALRLGEADRAADEPLDPSPQREVFARDCAPSLLRVLCCQMPGPISTAKPMLA